MVEKLRILRLSYTPFDHRYSNDKSVFNELHKQADVVFLDIVKLKDAAKIDAQISELVKKHSFDLIYKNFVGSVDTLKMRPLYEYGIPVFVSSGDCHTRLQSSLYNQKSNYHRFDVIIVNNRSTVSCFKNYFDRDMSYVWLPWSYNPEFHRDYNVHKEYDVSIPAGHIRIAMRKSIHDYLKSDPCKYTWIKGLSPQEYGKRINQCHVAVSTCQVEHRLIYKEEYIGMTFTKYYEIPMCGALHIGQRSSDAERLGFVSGENVVMFDTFEEFKDVFRFYFDREKERLRIIANARKHVEPMTYENRVKRFLLTARKYI